jgi:hypothetical protein
MAENNSIAAETRRWHSLGCFIVDALTMQRCIVVDDNLCVSLQLQPATVIISINAQRVVSLQAQPAASMSPISRLIAINDGAKYDTTLTDGQMANCLGQSTAQDGEMEIGIPSPGPPPAKKKNLDKQKDPMWIGNQLHAR